MGDLSKILNPNGVFSEPCMQRLWGIILRQRHLTAAIKYSLKIVIRYLVSFLGVPDAYVFVMLILLTNAPSTRISTRTHAFGLLRLLHLISVVILSQVYILFLCLHTHSFIPPWNHTKMQNKHLRYSTYDPFSIRIGFDQCNLGAPRSYKMDGAERC